MRKLHSVKASFTVEACLLMSVILFVIMGTLYLFFHVHNRAWLTCAAYEAALTGSMAESSEPATGYVSAWTKGQMLGNSGFYGGEYLRMDVSLGSSLEVTYDMDTRASFGAGLWHMSVSGSSHILEPVKWIRQTKAASELIFH